MKAQLDTGCYAFSTNSAYVLTTSWGILFVNLNLVFYQVGTMYVTTYYLRTYLVFLKIIIIKDFEAEPFVNR